VPESSVQRRLDHSQCELPVIFRHPSTAGRWNLDVRAAIRHRHRRHARAFPGTADLPRFWNVSARATRGITLRLLETWGNGMRVRFHPSTDHQLLITRCTSHFLSDRTELAKDVQNGNSEMSNFFAVCLGDLLRIEDGSKIQLSQFDYSRPAIEYTKKFTPDRKQRSWRST
jgi:hypothetical protein